MKILFLIALKQNGNYLKETDIENKGGEGKCSQIHTIQEAAAAAAARANTALSVKKLTLLDQKYGLGVWGEFPQCAPVA